MILVHRVHEKHPLKVDDLFVLEDLKHGAHSIAVLLLAHLHELYPEIQRETDYARLVEDPELHAIAIATAVPLHFPMARRALLAGKHVMLEKPMAASVAECEELIAISRRLGLVLMVGHTFLFSEPIRKIREIVDHRDIGELRYIASRRLNLGLFQRDINVAWDLAPHDISRSEERRVGKEC